MLDALILSQLNQGDVYGYALTQQLKDVLETSESSLYPVLRRLQKSDCLETYDVPYQGRLRRFYHITNQGKKMLEFYRAQWKEYKTCIGSFLEKK